MKERESEERLEENQSKLWLCKYEFNDGSSYDEITNLYGMY